MRLLWVLLVVVGVAGGVAKKMEEGRLLTLEEIYKLESNQSEERSCWQEGEVDLCKNGFLFTATALKEVRGGEELEVLLTLEKSLHPHVTFDLSLRSLGDRDLSEFSDEEEWPEEEEVLARKRVTLEVNELRRVVLRVSDLPWRTAYLVVTALQTGHSESVRHTYAKIQKVTSDAEVYVQAEKSEYAPGNTVNYRALVVDGNFDKMPKFAQVILSTFNLRLKETRLPWVEVPQSGILTGNFTFDVHTNVKVLVTSDVTSSDTSMATTPTLRIYERTRESDNSYDPQPSHWNSVTLEGLSDVTFSQPRVKGRVKLTSPKGLPLDGNCNVTISRDYGGKIKFVNKMAERRVAVGLAGGEFEFDVVEELGAERQGAGDWSQLRVDAKCRDLQSGSVVQVEETMQLYGSLFRVDLLSVETLPKGNSSHPQATVVLQFLVERRDGGSVEEEEPKKGLHLKLLLSKKNLERLRPSGTNFSLPIPANGRVRLEFQVAAMPPSKWEDRVRMEVGDAEEEARLFTSGGHLEPTIHVTPIDPARLIRRGDVVQFRVRSCLPYDNVNAILSSHKTIYSSRRFSFSPGKDQLDEVIQLAIPQNAAEGSLTLTVSGRNTIKDTPYGHTKAGERTSLKLNLVSSHEQQFIRIVDQVDVDMSTIVTLRLEGMFEDSVVSLQAAKMESPGGFAGEETEGPLKCHSDGYVGKRKNAGSRIRDDSPGDAKPGDLEISTNFEFNKKLPSEQHPPLVFFDFDRKTSTEDNRTLTVTWTFDRLTEFGTYVVSGATFNWKWGRTVFSNSPVFTVLPPGTLGASVAPSAPFGESDEIISYGKNTRASSDEGSSEEGSSEVMEEIVKVKPTVLEVTNLKKNDHPKKGKKPQTIGDLFDSLSSKFPADSQLPGKSNI